MNRGIPFKDTFLYWLKLGFISFGGPTGQIAMMHKEIVENKKWMDEDQFLHALNFCMFLPGPEAQQLATYIGWTLNSTRGALAAGVLFVLPSVFILWGLSWIYAAFGTIPAVSALFYGLKPAVAAIVAEAVIRIGKKSLKTGTLVVLASLSFIAIYFLNIPFPVIIVSAGIIGYLFNRRLSGQGEPLKGAVSESVHDSTSSGWGRTIRIATFGLLLWFSPMILIGLWLGWDSILVNIGVLFSKAAVVTFGGAYAVLGYIGQQAVNHYGWLTQEQMMDGLALAETTPGPLIMVNQFVAYVAAYLHTQGLTPAVAGAVGGVVATWVTFVPSTLWIFIGAPYIESLRRKVRLSSALTAITAAVVGVVLNLAVNFTRHTLLPETGGFQWYALAASIISFVGMTKFKWGMIPVIIGSALAGYIWKQIL
ncbi:MAG TPA: chromate efflux transporter [Thermodesulfovibrionales bacterium]|nr:chromate efflux transporter [Thermodesulfovibrionales bacterium]